MCTLHVHCSIVCKTCKMGNKTRTENAYCLEDAHLKVLESRAGAPEAQAAHVRQVAYLHAQHHCNLQLTSPICDNIPYQPLLAITTSAAAEASRHPP